MLGWTEFLSIPVITNFFLEKVTSVSTKYLIKAITQNIHIYFLTLILSSVYITYKCIKILPKNFA
jgi:hypothetical protein